MADGAKATRRALISICPTCDSSDRPVSKVVRIGDLCAARTLASRADVVGSHGPHVRQLSTPATYRTSGQVGHVASIAGICLELCVSHALV